MYLHVNLCLTKSLLHVTLLSCIFFLCATCVSFILRNKDKTQWSFDLLSLYYKICGISSLSILGF